MTASKKVFWLDMAAAVVENDFREVFNEDEVASRDIKNEEGAAQTLLYPPAPPLAIFCSTRAIDSYADKFLLDPDAPVFACTGNRNSRTIWGNNRARNTPASRPIARDRADMANDVIYQSTSQTRETERRGLEAAKYVS